MDLHNCGTSDHMTLKLEDRLCFALYVSSKEMIKLMRPFLAPCGLTYTGYITMLVLWENEGMSLKELGERLTLDSGTLTPLLKKLESNGYIKRTRDGADERIVRLTLTESGRALREELSDADDRLFAAAAIDPQKTVLLTDYLNRLCRYIRTEQRTAPPASDAAEL